MFSEVFRGFKRFLEVFRGCQRFSEVFRDFRGFQRFFRGFQRSPHLQSRATEHKQQKTFICGIRGVPPIPERVSAAPQQSEICVKFSVFHTVFDVNFSQEWPEYGWRT